MKITRKQFVTGGKGELKDPDSFDFREFEVGKLIEMEHTSDPKIAEGVAKDHLTEDPKYYTKLLSLGVVDEEPALKKARELGLI